MFWPNAVKPVSIERIFQASVESLALINAVKPVSIERIQEEEDIGAAG